MTLPDDLMAPTTPATPGMTGRKCGRHQWQETATYAQCIRCGRRRDESTVRRNRRNRQNGASLERAVAKDYGGRRTGPLGGRGDVMVGQMFSIQTKRALRLSLNEARVYLADLARTYPDRIPVVIHALPGERGGVVIWRREDHVALHGADGIKEGAPE